MADKGDHRPGERIAKVMARAGLCSRRQAEAWIVAGRVAVNGTAITSPAVNVTSQDRVTVDGAPLPKAERTRMFLFHKPRGLVTTSADPEGRPTIFGALPKHLPRLISVGRLDLSTEGLLLLTNDGGLARVLELPETGWLRRYRVRAHGRVTQDQLDALRQGVTIGGIRYGAIEATLDREQGANVWLTFAIREGKNREVRNVLEHLGLKVARLIRISFGPFQLGELEPGAIEEIRTRHLREQLGERIAREAGCDFAAPITAPNPSRNTEPIPAKGKTQETSRLPSPASGGRPSTPGVSVVPDRESSVAGSPGRKVYTRAGPTGRREAPPDGRLRPGPGAGRRQPKERGVSQRSEGASGTATQRLKPKGGPPDKRERDKAPRNSATKPRARPRRYHGKRKS
jgi:23S rRNA pseudouridine2605 synthase